MKMKEFMNENSGDSLEAFDKLVGAHDLTYEYSDDHRYWVKGKESLSQIRGMMSRLVAQDPANKKKCVDIWNKWVDKKLVKSEAPNWYWEEK